MTARKATLPVLAKLEASSIPQATLDTLRGVVDACARWPGRATHDWAAPALSQRHRDYGVVAASTLGFVVRRGDTYFPTLLGKALSATARGSDDERDLLREAIDGSPILQAIAPDLLRQNAPDRARIEQKMTLAGLSPATAAHRTGMLLAWRRLLGEPGPQLDLFRAARSRGMWRRVEIRNFRSIESADVVLAPFTLVVGPNGSGKSNFADALVFARDVAFDASTAVSSRGGLAGVRRWRKTKPTDVTIDVRASTSQSGLESSFSRHMFKIHSGKSGDWSFSSEAIEAWTQGKRTAYVERSATQLTGTITDGSAMPSGNASAMLVARQLKPFSKTSALQNVRRYRLNPEAMRQPQLSTEDTRLRESGENIAAAIRHIANAGKLDRIVKSLGKIVPGLTGISVEQVARHLALRFRQAQGTDDSIADFNATEMSEGALRALGIIVATSQMERDELLIIEEPEVSIHVGAARLLFDLLKDASERGAVLVTTHSADLLDAARDEEILVCEYAAGATTIGPMDDAQRDLVRQGLFSVAELMRSEPLRIQRGAPKRARSRSSG